MEQNKDSLLEIHDLSVTFQMRGAGSAQALRVLSDLHLRVRAGEIVAVAGASGSGKSVLAAAIFGILPQNAVVSGHLHYRGEQLTPQLQERLRGSEFALVPQSVSFLDPLLTVGAQTDGYKKAQNRQQRGRIFKRLGLPAHTPRLYPFQLSGGMARRVLVATALLSDAQLIVADEPTPGMSPAQAKEALQMFRELADAGKAVLLITHDIDLAVEVADRVAVFYAGTTVETAPAADFGRGGQALRHPYTRALWRALPQNDFTPIAGTQPYAGSPQKGCLFAPRCPYRTKQCEQCVPPVRTLRGGEVRCLYDTESRTDLVSL